MISAHTPACARNSHRSFFSIFFIIVAKINIISETAKHFEERFFRGERREERGERIVISTGEQGKHISFLSPLSSFL
jgi:hypothetical protein